MGQKVKEFNRLLFRWYVKNHRVLPWRKTRNPYRILVSEIMLQQTPVARVLPKYAEFLKKFPAIKTLASKTLGEVLRVWSGLGYNRRAKYIWECAQEICSKHRGIFPRERAVLQTLPGVGPSTAAALEAFAFGRDEPMIDTNVRRVLCRVFFGGRAISDRALRDFARTLIPQGRGKDWNWAVMDIGALLCGARRHCLECPFGRLHGVVTPFQYKKPASRFCDSTRFYRGKVLASLASAGFRGREVSRLRRETGLHRRRLSAILSSLKKEQLVREKGEYVILP